MNTPYFPNNGLAKRVATRNNPKVQKAQSGKYLIWIKEKKGDPWEEQGEGPLTKLQADRIAKDIRGMCAAIKVLPVGMEPEVREGQKRQHFDFGQERKILSQIDNLIAKIIPQLVALGHDETSAELIIRDHLDTLNIA